MEVQYFEVPTPKLEIMPGKFNSNNKAKRPRPKKPFLTKIGRARRTQDLMGKRCPHSCVCTCLHVQPLPRPQIKLTPWDWKASALTNAPQGWPLYRECAKSIHDSNGVLTF